MLVPFIPNTLDQRSENWLSLFRQKLPEFRIEYLDNLSEEEKRGVQVAIVANPNAAELTSLPNLQWMHSTWAGVEKVLPVAKELNIPLVRMQDPNLADVMAEAVLTWSLFLYRRIPCYLSQQAEKTWFQHPLPVRHQFTIAILGMGKLGQASCALLQSVGFRVIGWGRKKKSDCPCDYFYGHEQLLQVLELADVIVILLPETEDTRQLISAPELRKMKPTASIINVGRAGILDTQALRKALEYRDIYHAVLDVFDKEPLQPTDSEWQLPHATLLPHVAAPTNPETASTIIADNLRRYDETGEIPESVNLERGY